MRWSGWPTVALMVAVPGCGGCDGYAPIEQGGELPAGREGVVTDPLPGGPKARRGGRKGKPGARRGRADGRPGRGGAGKGALGGPVSVPPVPDCMAFDGPTTVVTGPNGGHHPTAIPLPDGGWVVAWQRGRDADGIVEARRLDASLAAQGEPVVISEAGGATHPALAAASTDADRVQVAWTREPAGTPAWRDVVVAPEGLQAPQDPVQALDEPGAFPDLVRGPTGIVRTMTSRDAGATRWLLDARDAGGALTRLGPAAHGGPAALDLAPDGSPWLAWAPLDPAGPGELFAAPVQPSAAEGLGPTLDLGAHQERRERTTLAFPDATHVAVGWTRYPGHGEGWGIGMDVVPVQGGAPIGRQRLEHARMLDLDGGHGALLAGWEQPIDRGVHKVAVMALDGAGVPLCGPAPIDAEGPPWQARAEVHLTGPGRGVVFWQAGADRDHLGVMARALRWTAAD